MNKILVIMITAVFGGTELVAQTEKFDIASFIPPKGWQRIDSGGMLVFHDYRTNNDLTSFCQIFLFPNRISSGSPAKDFEEEWHSKVELNTGVKVTPTTETEKSPDGWTVVRGVTNITKQGLTYTCMLVAMSGFGKVMSILVNLAGQEFLAELDNFFKSLDLDKNAATNNKTGNFSWDNYSYIAPARWYMQKTKDYVLLHQSQTIGEGCAITIFPPMASSGSLEKDAKSIFSQMYPGWQYRYNGENRDALSKGFTPQGLEYFMMEAPMHKMRPDGYYYDYEDGAVLVIGNGKQITVIAGRHNRLMACFCNHQYEYWRRFFNSFTVKNAILPKTLPEPVSKRIIGDWMSMGGSALSEYIFAANGNYQFIGAFATTTKTTSGGYEYLNIRTSGFKGDGAYTFKGNQLTFRKHGGKQTEQVTFRFDKVNRGGLGWKDRLFMYKKDQVGEYEVGYEKQVK